MKAALLREGTHPAAGSTFGHVHGAEVGDEASARPVVRRRGSVVPALPWPTHPWRGHAQPVKPAPFRYADPGTLDEALAVLSARG